MATRNPKHHPIVDSILKATLQKSGELSLDGKALARLQKELQAIPLGEAKRALRDLVATASVIATQPKGKKVAAAILSMANAAAGFQLDALKVSIADDSEKRVVSVQRRFKTLLGE